MAPGQYICRMWGGKLAEKCQFSTLKFNFKLNTVRPETQQGELNGESVMSSGAPGGPDVSNSYCNFRNFKK